MASAKSFVLESLIKSILASCLGAIISYAIYCALVYFGVSFGTKFDYLLFIPAAWLGGVVVITLINKSAFSGLGALFIANLPSLLLNALFLYLLLTVFAVANIYICEALAIVLAFLAQYFIAKYLPAAKR